MTKVRRRRARRGRLRTSRNVVAGSGTKYEGALIYRPDTGSSEGRTAQPGRCNGLDLHPVLPFSPDRHGDLLTSGGGSEQQRLSDGGRGRRRLEGRAYQRRHDPDEPQRSVHQARNAALKLVGAPPANFTLTTPNARPIAYGTRRTIGTLSTSGGGATVAIDAGDIVDVQ